MKVQLLLVLLNILLFGCVTGVSTKKQNDSFPDNWWQVVSEDQIADWEIPPQAADRLKSEVILSKRNELGQFSNLQAAPFYMDGDYYASVEALWQSMKFPENKDDERLKDPAVVWPMTREQVMKLSGFEAKKAGDLASHNMRKLGIAWVTYKGKKIDYTGKEANEHYELILRACRAKLAANPQLIDLLRRTKNLTFMSDHKQRQDSPPAYRYHEIYMKLREELGDVNTVVP